MVAHGTSKLIGLADSNVMSPGPPPLPAFFLPHCAVRVCRVTTESPNNPNAWRPASDDTAAVLRPSQVRMYCLLQWAYLFCYCTAPITCASSCHHSHRQGPVPFLWYISNPYLSRIPLAESEGVNHIYSVPKPMFSNVSHPSPSRTRSPPHLVHRRTKNILYSFGSVAAPTRFAYDFFSRAVLPTLRESVIEFVLTALRLFSGLQLLADRV